MATLRAFIAVPVSPALREQASQLQKMLAAPVRSLRPTRSGQFHLTLVFFAGLPEEQVELVKDSMLTIGRCSAPFNLTFTTFGAFPSFRRARVFWLGPAPHAETPLSGIQSRLVDSLQQAGVHLDRRPFHPHLTLGRVRSPVRVDAGLAEQFQPRALESRVTHMTLYASRLAPGGAVHSELLTVPFSATHNPM